MAKELKYKTSKSKEKMTRRWGCVWEGAGLDGNGGKVGVGVKVRDGDGDGKRRIRLGERAEGKEI